MMLHRGSSATGNVLKFYLASIIPYSAKRTLGQPWQSPRSDWIYVRSYLAGYTPSRGECWSSEKVRFLQLFLTTNTHTWHIPKTDMNKWINDIFGNQKWISDFPKSEFVTSWTKSADWSGILRHMTDPDLKWTNSIRIDTAPTPSLVLKSPHAPMLIINPAV